MSAQAILDQLMDSRQVWAHRDAGAVGHAQDTAAGIPTGFAALDAALPMGGWPLAALTELLLPCWGLGELQWLWPTLARLSRQGGRVVLVAPPFVPYAITWQRAGVDLSCLDVIEAERAEDALWCIEQCLRSACCAAVLGWPETASHTVLRRLQVAADHGQTPGFMLRAQRHAQQASPAALRVQLSAGGQLRILKCRGGAAPDRVFCMG